MEIILIAVVIVVAAAIALMAMRSRSRQARLLRRHQHVGTEVDVKGGQINVVELGGQRRGPCLVLLHGSGANLEDLRVTIGERLARDCRVLLVDRPGRGWSSDLDIEDGDSPEAQAIALNQVLGKLGVEKPVIVGHDIGATVALAYALSYPEDIGGLVVISPISHREGLRLSLAQRVALIPWVGPIFTWLWVPVYGVLSQRRQIARGFAPASVPSDYYDGIDAELALRPATFISEAEERAALGAFLEEQSQFYAEIGVPVVVIAGDEDRIADSKAHAGRLAREIPGGRWVVLNEVGHYPHHVSPNVILFEINRLVERLWSEMVA